MGLSALKPEAHAPQSTPTLSLLFLRTAHTVQPVGRGVNCVSFPVSACLCLSVSLSVRVSVCLSVYLALRLCVAVAVSVPVAVQVLPRSVALELRNSGVSAPVSSNTLTPDADP